MEGSSAPLTRTAARRDASAVRATQIGLLIASLGAFLIIFHPFGLGVLGIFLVLGGTAVAAPGGLGQGWFWAVVIGAIVAALSRLIADSSETLGGWLAVIGSLVVMIGAVLGFPIRGEQD